MKPRVSQDLESLSKDLYLESPDLWIDFSDKINDNIFDELVLFFATKYNYMSVVDHVVTNKLLDLNLKSKNREFNTVYNHLLYIAKQNKDKEIYNYLLNLYNPSFSKSSKIEDVKVEEAKSSSHIPTLLCKNCNKNIFEKGYIVCENKTFSFSTEENKPVEISKDLLPTVLCASCKTPIPDTTPAKLELLCNINNCVQCGNDLKSVGIIDKKIMTYDENTSSFTSSNSEHVCIKCNTPLSKKQKQIFNIQN